MINAPDIEIATNIFSNDPGKVYSNFFCYAATVLSPHRKVYNFTCSPHRISLLFKLLFKLLSFLSGPFLK